jgi:putative phosphoribosyl transferase
MKTQTPELSVSLPFANRTQAGRLLASELTFCQSRPDIIVLGLPRGGLPVAYEIAQCLEASLDVLLVRKLGVPGQKELAFGAIAMGGVRVLDSGIIGQFQLTPRQIEEIAAEELEILESRNQLYRQGRPAPRIRERTVIVADDGIATGSTMRAAVQALRQQEPSHIVVAAPVASVDAAHMLRRNADDVVCLAQPEPFYAVGYWYRDFWQISDDEVRWFLEKAAKAPAA